MKKESKNHLLVSAVLATLIGVSASYAAITASTVNKSPIFKSVSPVNDLKNWGDKNWNIVHSLGSNRRMASILLKYLIKRKALNRSTEAEAVLLYSSFTDYKITNLHKKLTDAGYDVFIVVDAQQQQSNSPTLIIFDQNRSIQYLGEYGEKFRFNPKSDLVQLIKLRNVKNADLLPLLGSYVPPKKQGLANLLSASYSKYNF